MKDLLLAIDIGNTTIECGLFVGAKLVADWRLASAVPRTPDECWLATSFFLRDARVEADNLRAVAVASVVPEHTGSFTEMARRFDPDPLVISIETCPFLKVHYQDPRQVGADRLCNAFGGFRLFGGPLIVVDFGTATTLDVVDAEGAYLGGVILPGPLSAASLLHRRTAQLPEVALAFPDRVIGDATEHAIRAGLTWGIVDMVDGLIDRIAGELGAKPKVVATGGLAEPYAQRSRNFTSLHPHLVLEGIRLINERARSGK